MEYSPVVIFDPTAKGGISYHDWKRKTMSALRAVAGLAKFVEKIEVPVPVREKVVTAPVDTYTETLSEFETRLDKYISNKEKAVKMIHDRVSLDIYSRLEPDWSPYETFEFLDKTYGLNVAVNLAVKFEELFRLTLSASDDPTVFCSRIEQLINAVKTIVVEKNIDKTVDFLGIMGTLLVLRSLNIEPYKILRETIIGSDIIIDTTIASLRVKMIGLQTANQSTNNPLGLAAQNGQNDGRPYGNNLSRNGPSNPNNSGGATAKPKGPYTELCFRCWETGHKILTCKADPIGFTGFKGNSSDPNIGKMSPRICFNCWSSGHDRNFCKNASRPFPGMLKAVALIAAAPTLVTSDWLLDSGASSHMTGSRENVIDIQPSNETVSGLGNFTLVATGKGRLVGYVGNLKIDLSDVLVIPGLERNLISEGALYEQGYQVVSKDGDKFVSDGTHRALIHRSNNVYPLTVMVQPSQIGLATKVLDYTLVHNRYGHPSDERLKNTVPEVVISKTSKCCHSCVMGKSDEDPYPDSASGAHPVLAVIAADIMGPFRHESHGGERYALSVLDIGSHFGWVYLLKHKSEATQCLMDLIKLIKTQYGKQVPEIQTDNGGEFTNNVFERFIKDSGMKHRKTIRGAHQQNGSIERYNGILQEKMRVLLAESGLPSTPFWGDAMLTACYLDNYTTTAAKGMDRKTTPFEALEGKPPSNSHLRVFGCHAVVHDPYQTDKTTPRAVDAIFIGYNDNPHESIKGWKFWNPRTSKVFYSRDAVFMEDDFWKSVPALNTIMYELVTPEDESDEVYFSSKLNNPAPKMVPSSKIVSFNPKPILEESSPEKYYETEEDEESNSTSPFSSPPPSPTSGAGEKAFLIDGNIETRRTSRSTAGKLGKPFWQVGNVAIVNVASIIPKNYKEAALNISRWAPAMDAEMKNHHDKQTWELVDLPADRRALSGGWIYDEKKDANGTAIQDKARWVIHGCSQVYGIDVGDNTFAPTTSLDSVRVMTALIAAHDLEARTLDIKAAFLNAPLKDVVYMKQPTGYNDGTSRVCRLLKALYGLKQAPHEWYSRLVEWFSQHGFKQLLHNPSIYLREGLYVQVHVDDFMIASKVSSDLDSLESELERDFELKRCGELTWFLGMLFTRDRINKIIYISQESFIKDILTEFQMLDCNPVDTPMDKLPVVKGALYSDQSRYRQAIGMLLYLARTTRPDLMASVAILAQYSGGPTMEHWTGIKRLLKYLKGTSNYGLILGVDTNLLTYCDADWAGDQTDRKSRSGWILKLGIGAVMWGSRKQQGVAISSSEAEYVSLSEGIKDLIWLAGLLEELGFPMPKPLVVFEDNRGAQLMAQNDVTTSRAKHIDIRYHFIRDHVRNGYIAIKSCPTREMVADFLTKPLVKHTFEWCRSAAGIATR